jgi:hypothetical protein
MGPDREGDPVPNGLGERQMATCERFAAGPPARPFADLWLLSWGAGTLLARGGDRRYLRSFSACSLRLAAQDVALSRRKQGFESPRERQSNQSVNIFACLHAGSVRKLYGKDAPELRRTSLRSPESISGRISRSYQVGFQANRIDSSCDCSIRGGY